jgi:hypothetical protein
MGLRFGNLPPVGNGQHTWRAWWPSPPAACNPARRHSRPGAPRSSSPWRAGARERPIWRVAGRGLWLHVRSWGLFAAGEASAIRTVIPLTSESEGLTITRSEGPPPPAPRRSGRSRGQFTLRRSTLSSAHHAHLQALGTEQQRVRRQRQHRVDSSDPGTAPGRNCPAESRPSNCPLAVPSATYANPSTWLRTCSSPSRKTSVRESQESTVPPIGRS